MATHGTPEAGMECACCYDDIESGNYVEYRTGEGDLLRVYPRNVELIVCLFENHL